MTELLKRVERSGLKPKSDDELLPHLLELLGTAVPVRQWPTQKKSQRVDLSREVHQAQAAAVDRTGLPEPSPGIGGDTTQARPMPGWQEKARQVQGAVDSERRRRREAITFEPQPPPPRLGHSYRIGNLFALPAEDDDPLVDADLDQEA